MRGYVTHLTINSDTLKDITVRNGNDTMKFYLDEAKFPNGVMMVSDSVLVAYIDNGSNVYMARYVTTLVKPGNVIELGKKNNNKLITAPDSDVDHNVKY